MALFCSLGASVTPLVGVVEVVGVDGVEVVVVVDLPTC